MVCAGFARELELENLALKATLSAIEEREAACCPEDVPFDEMIASMGRKKAELKALADHWARECENLAKWLRESRDENAELKRLVEQLTEALKEVRLYSCSHMQSTTHDTIDAALKAAKE